MTKTRKPSATPRHAALLDMPRRSVEPSAQRKITMRILGDKAPAPPAPFGAREIRRLRERPA